MNPSLVAVRPALSSPRRLLLFGAAIALGVIGGNGFSVEASDWAYTGLLRLFADPGVQIASQAAGVGLGFVLGFIHITSV